MSRLVTLSSETARLLALFVLAVLAFQFPLLLVWSWAGRVLGAGAPLVTALFIVWLALIALLARWMERPPG
jgi:hypothetical protein